MYRDDGLGVGDDVSLVYSSFDTSHSYYHHRNESGIYDDVSLGVYLGDERGGYRSQDTSHYSSCNSGFYRCGDQSGDTGRGVYWYQDTSHSSSHNLGASVDGYGRGGYRSQIINFTSHKTCCDDRRGIFRSQETRKGGYRSQTSHSPYHNPDGRGRCFGGYVASSCVLTRYLSCHNRGGK